MYLQRFIFSVFISHYLSQLIAFYNVHALDCASLIILTLSGTLHTLHPLCLFISSPMLVRLMLVCFHISVSPVVLSYHPKLPFYHCLLVSAVNTLYAIRFVTLSVRCYPSIAVYVYCHPFGVPYRHRVRFPSVADAKIRPKTYAKQIFSVNKC